MKKLSLFFSLLLLLISSCESHKIIEKEEVGYLYLSSVSVDKKTDVITRNSQNDIISIDIIDSSGKVIKHSDDWNDISQEAMILPVGEYLIKAYSLVDNNSESDYRKAIYKGQTNIVLEKGKVSTAQVVCRLAKSKVTISFSERLKNAIPTYSVVIVNNGRRIPAQENISYYLTSGNGITSELSFTNAGGTTHVNTKIVSEKSRDAVHYKVLYDISNNGNSAIGISVDNSLTEYDIDVTISAEDSSDEVIRTLTVNNVWAQLAEVRGSYDNAKNVNLSFEYKKVSDESWQEILAVGQGSSYHAVIRDLSPNTEYVCRFKAGDKFGNEVRFVTDGATPLYNGNFDIWSRSNNIWFAGTQEEADSRNSFWDSGNVGTSTLSKYPTKEETSDVHTQGGKAARLESQFVGFLGFGKFAAGNIYTGHFVKTIGTSGAEIRFGVPFTGRPTKLRGWYKYSAGNIDYNGSLPDGTTINRGTKDKCAIYLALSDKGTPYTVNTSSKTFVDYKQDPNIIAYGELKENQTNSTNGWQQFEIDINYRSFNKKPTHLIIVASASRYGDYFIGSTSSVMLIDDFELIYDSNPVIENNR